MNFLRVAQRAASSPVGMLGSLTLVGQGILALSLPIAARLYGAYAVGVFAAILALGQAGAIVASGRIEQILPRVSLSRRRVVGPFVAGISLALSLVIGPLVAWQAAALSWSIALATTFLVSSLALYSLANMSLLAARDFHGVARLRIVNSVGTALFQIVGGVWAPNPGTLVAAYAAGSLLAAGLALPKGRVAGLPRRERFTVIAREERILRFSLSVGASALLTSLTLGLPVLGLAYIYGEEVAASFFLVRRLLALPTQLVASTVNEVSYSLLAKKSAADVSQYMRRWVRRLAWGGLGILALAVVGAFPAQWVLGKEYIAVAWVMVIQAPAAAAQLLGTSLSNVLLVLHAEHIRLIVNLGRFLALLGALGVLAIGGFGYVSGVLMLSIVTVVGLGFLLWVTLRVVDRAEREERA